MASASGAAADQGVSPSTEPAMAAAAAAAAAEEGESPLTALATDDLLILIVGAVCRSPPSARVLVRPALRLRLVSHGWRQATDACLCAGGASTSFDFLGIRCVPAVRERLLGAAVHTASDLSLCGDNSFGAEAPDLSDLPALTALSLYRLDDLRAASALERVGMESGDDRHPAHLQDEIGLSRLRSLRLCGMPRCGDAIRYDSATLSILCLRGLPSLTYLDLSGTPAISRFGPGGLASLLAVCPRLTRLDLSYGGELTFAALEVGLETVATQLTALTLDGSELKDETCVAAPLADGSSHIAVADSLRVRPLCRLSRLRELSLRENPSLSGRAIVALLQLPELRSLDISGADLWPAELPLLLEAISAAPSLRSLTLEDCSHWLDDETLRQLRRRFRGRLRYDPPPPATAKAHAASAVTAAARSASNAGTAHRCEAGACCEAGCQLHEPPADTHTPLDPPNPITPTPIDSWEDVAAALGDAALPPALSLPQHAADDASRSGGASRVPRYQMADYSRPAAYRTKPRSIYHVSHGARPLYGDGSASVTSVTDAHGLRS